MERPVKRMRKGTKSCLACRRRKSRCIFPSTTNTTCRECAERGIECIPQGIVTPRNEFHSRTPEQHRVGTGLGRSVEETISSASAPLLNLMQSSKFGSKSQERPGSSHNKANPAVAADSRLDHRLRDELLECMPSHAEKEDIFSNKSSWWPLWRETLDLIWGNPNCNTLRDFAEQALLQRDPALLSILLICFAISTGESQRFLVPVEKQILYDDELASTEHGLSCLMALGICYISSMRPRKAWVAYKRANMLIQLNGLPTTHRNSARKTSTFWQLFHADRWVSLMIGLPYTIQDHFCDVEIESIGPEMTPATFLYRHLAVITGRVIDCLQGFNGPTLASVLQIDDSIEAVLVKMPDGYLDMDSIKLTTDKTQKLTRLYRLLHVCLLRSYIHLPFFLRSCGTGRYDYSRQVCIDSSRGLINAYLGIYDLEPEAVWNGGVLNFNAFFVAVILLLDLLGYGRLAEDNKPISDQYNTWQMLNKTIVAIQSGTNGIASELCGRCSTALSTLVQSATSLEQEPKEVTLPYFGKVKLSRQNYHARGEEEEHSTEQWPNITHPNGVPSGTSESQDPFWFENSVPDDLALAYFGPFLGDTQFTWDLDCDWMLQDSITFNELT